MREKLIERAVKRQQIKQDESKGLKSLVLVLIVLISGALIAGSLLMLLTYSQTIEQEAEYVATRYAGETANHLKVAVDEYEDRAEALVLRGMQEEANSQEEFAANLRHLGLDEKNLGNIRLYFKNGTGYRSNGQPCELSSEAPEIQNLVTQDVRACAGVVRDWDKNVSMVAFVVPVHGCPYADSIVLFYGVTEVISFPEPLSP